MREGIASLALLLTLSSAAFANEDPRPWAEGVPKERQSSALRLFEDGNRRFSERAYSEALKLYQQALEQWDHPGIRFNLAECLLQLDRPLEAYENIVRALEHGEAALGRTFYERAIANKEMLEKRLGTVTVSCEEEGAQVTLDGERLFVGPGAATRMVLPGTHQIVASKDGHITQTKEELILPAQSIDLALTLPVPAPVRFERRWPIWMPWVVIGGGVVIGLVGVALRFTAQAQLDAYDEEVLRFCPAQGCLPSDLPGETAALRSRGRAQNGGAIAGYSLGGAVALAGVVLAILNQLQPLEPTSAP